MVGRRERRAVAAGLVALVAALLGPSGASAAAPPANDDFADAAPVGPLPATKSIDTSAATDEPGEPSCLASAYSVWYRIKPSTTTTLRVDTIGSGYNTAIGIWRGSSLTALTLVACDWDIDDDGLETELNARVAFTALADTRYYIQVVGQEGIGGGLTVHVKQVTTPPNDRFGKAKAITSLPFDVTADNRNATLQSGEPTICNIVAATRWYHFTSTHDMTVRADTFGTGFDTVLAVLTGSSVGSLDYRACDDAVSLDGALAQQASVTWRAKAGKRYYLQVGGYRNQTGPIRLHVQRVTPPANDDFGSATAISSLPASLGAGNRNATHQAGDPVSACGSELDQTRWYRFTPSLTTDLRVQVTADDGAAQYVAIFSGDSLGSLVEVDCGEDDPVFFTATPDTTYHFMVGGTGGSSGPMTFNLELD